MARSDAAADDRSYISTRHHNAAARGVLTVSGALIVLSGAGLVIGGMQFASSSGYYILTGLLLIFTGTLIANRKRAGAWAFMAVFAATLAWSLGNVQFGGSPLTLRLIGPITVLAMIALQMPALRGWRPQTTVFAFAGLVAGTIAIGISSSTGGAFARPTAAVAQLLDSSL